MAKHKKKKKIKKSSQSANTKKSTEREQSSEKSVLVKVSVVIGILAGIATIIGVVFNFFHKENPSNVTNNYSIENTINNYAYGENVPDLSQANEYYSQGQEYFRMSDYENALQRYHNALDEYENNPVSVDKARIQYAIGLLYKKKGNLEEAIQWYSDSIGTLNSLTESDKIENELSYIYYLRGNAYLENRDLERAQLDCKDCFAYLNPNVSQEKCTYASALCLKGRIYMASYYGTHSEYQVNGGVDLGVSWLDAMDCFEEALGWNGMRLCFANSEDVFSGNNTTVKSFKNIEFSGVTLVSKTGNSKLNLGDYYWLIKNPDAETAAILNYRATLLLMVGIESAFYLNEAEVNSEIALQIYNDLPADKREGIQDTYFNLAMITLIKDLTENENNTNKSMISKTYCEQLEQALNYTKKWCGKSKSTAIAFENMGFAYILTGDVNSARESFLEAQSIFENLGLTEDATKQEENLECVDDPDGEWSVEIQWN